MVCGAETHLFFSYETIDASDTSASRDGAHVGQPAPKNTSEASYEARNEPEECLGSTMADGRSLASTVFHETPRNATTWPFLLAISEVGWAFKKAPL